MNVIIYFGGLKSPFFPNDVSDRTTCRPDLNLKQFVDQYFPTGLALGRSLFSIEGIPPQSVNMKH